MCVYIYIYIHKYTQNNCVTQLAVDVEYTNWISEEG